jgi:cytochrome c553
MRRRRLARWLIALLPPLCLALALPARRAQSFQQPDPFDKSIQPFLVKNCYVCHNPETRSGNLNLKTYTTAESLKADRETLEKMLQKLRAGKMPPPGMPRPDPAELDTVLQWISAEVERGDKTVGRRDEPVESNPGRVTARRLNRTEYNNTVRDLLGVDYHPADDFPQDDSGYGFDNIGDVLSLSPVLMEKYLATAEKIAHIAVFGPEKMQPTLARLHPPQGRINPSPKPLFDYDQTGLCLPNALHAIQRFPVDGEYVIRAILGGARPAGSDPLHVGLWIDGKEVQVLEFDAQGIATFNEFRQELFGLTREFRTKVSAGDHWIAVSLERLYEGLPSSYNGPNPAKRPMPPPPKFEPPSHLPPAKIEELRKEHEKQKAQIVPANDARINSIEIGGPYDQSKGPSAESLKDLYTCGHLNGHHKPGCARKVVADLARRAYRRPVTPREVDKLVGLVAAAQRQGDSFEEGLCVAIEAMLVSPHFLFRIEPDPPALATSAHAINQYELASRLSYFLWSSMPDGELLAAADRGDLNQPAVLAAQVRRMLQDPKSRALPENFGGQWLELRKLESAKPDHGRFPEFDDYLRMSMGKETELFFENIIHEDCSILDLIDADYSFLNERLARFYKIPGAGSEIKGPEFRKVQLSPETQRGGVMTQASILTVSSYATRTSPVLRGKWILENILNAPPPPPPPDVPNLDEAKIGSDSSLRVQLEQHRQNAMCASCHARMDPLGFGLENFNAIGAWRTQDGKFPIDASATLPDGRTFRGPQELKALMKSEPNAFAECLARKLLTYALGRGLEPYDNAAVTEIVKRSAANHYRFSTLVLEIVKSPPFQMRRGEGLP